MAQATATIEPTREALRAHVAKHDDRIVVSVVSDGFCFCFVDVSFQVDLAKLLSFGNRLVLLYNEFAKQFNGTWKGGEKKKIQLINSSRFFFQRSFIFLFLDCIWLPNIPEHTFDCR